MSRYVVLFFLIFIFTPVYAKKIALVIGNSAYDKNLSPLKLVDLPNSVNDAIDIANELEKLGFEVILKTDVGKRTMENAVLDFSERLRQRGTVGLFFFSGHGFTHNNINYLVPLQANIQSKIDIKYKAFPASYVLDYMKTFNKGVNIMILDACRNIISKDFFKNRKNKGLFKGVSSGLSDMKAPKNALIAYATAPDDTSWGGLTGERNSVYTKYLLRGLRNQSHFSITDLFIEVHKNVVEETKDIKDENNKKHPQVPWLSVSLTQRLCFGQCGYSKPNVSALLRTCAIHFRAYRLTTPPNSNAFSCYQKVLSRDETNQAALNGLTKIEQRYASLARRYFNKGNKKKAKRFLARLAIVNPDSPVIDEFDFNPPQPTSPISQSGVFQDRLKDGSRGPKMVWIPKGSFRMGDIQGGGQSDEKPVHRVSIDRFAMGKYEVTFAEYDKFATATRRSKPSDSGWGRGNRPVINVSWHDAVAYAKWLSKQTGKKYRLPTEAEWEYAARAGTETKYWWGNKIGKNRAACDGRGATWGYDAKQMTAPVGSFAANPFGIYDTVGNVWEWVHDVYDSSYYNSSPRSNPRGPSGGGRTGRFRVLRGGAWYDTALLARSAIRNGYSPDGRGSLLGFRLLRQP